MSNESGEFKPRVVDDKFDWTAGPNPTPDPSPADDMPEGLIASILDRLLPKEDMTTVVLPTRLIPTLMAVIDKIENGSPFGDDIDAEMIASRIVHAQACPDCGKELKEMLDKVFQIARHDIAVGDAPDGITLTPLGVTI